MTSGRVLSSGASVPVGLGCITSHYMDMCTNLEVPESLYLGEFYESSIT